MRIKMSAFMLSLLLLMVSLAPAGADEAKSTVYMTKDISPSGIMAIYEKLGREAAGKVAVKLSTGEAGNTHYLSPDLIKGLVQKVNGTIVECNTAYGGSRAETAMHMQVVEDHGFTRIAKVDLMDADGEIALPVSNGKHLKQNYVGSHFKDYDFWLVLSHFKGHAMAGLGGAIKNISIGIASSHGKVVIHSAGTRDTGTIMHSDQDAFLESMAEAAKSVSDSQDNGKRMMYISVMNHLSVDCDCDGNPAEPDMHDIGILGSLDPVALDQACVDLVYKAPDGQSLINRMESRHGIHTIEYAAEIGLGNRAYDLVNIDLGTSSSSRAAVPSAHLKFNLTRPAVTEIADVTYAQDFGWPGARLKMDILVPESSGKLPAVVFVTGGGFIAAPKTNYIQQRVHIAEAGYVVASVEYHIVPTGTYKDAVKDIKSAIRYLRAHADDFNIDPGRIAVMGESAGGYMSAMIGTTNGVKEFESGENLDQSSDVQAAIDIYGLSDLTKVGQDFSTEVQELHKSAGASEALFVNGIPPFGKGGSIFSDPDSAKAANPMTYISSKTAPFLLMHGDKDQLVSPSQTEMLHAALLEKGISSTRYVVEGAAHADHYWNQPEVERIILEFLDKTLKK